MFFIILPAYNEAQALELLLPRMLKALQDYPCRILVVDDGSTDGTAQTAACYQGRGVELLQHGRNKGLGEALYSGFETVLRDSEPEDVIITMDADNTHGPELIPAMSEQIAQGLDIVVASRFAVGGRQVGLPFYRRFLSRGAGVLMALFFPLPGVRDYSSGYRAYRAGFLARVLSEYGTGLIESGGFAVSVEILLKSAVLRPHCGEAPLVLRYDFKQGKSKMPLLRTIAGYVSLIFRLKRDLGVQPEVEA